MRKPLGISIGDPNGIGLEVALKACANFTLDGSSLGALGSLFEFIGDPDLIQTTAKNLNLPVPLIRESPVRFPMASYGECSAEAGTASAAWVDEGIQACLSGEVSALVTAPINKQAWNLAGVEFPGHTEFLADRCKTNRFGMLLAGKGLRVMLATRHVPISKVAEVLNETEIRMAVELLYEALPLFGLKDSRIAICGLNPHAGDGGAIGSEEVEWISPLIKTLQSEGLPVSGPHPADTVFHEAVKGNHDAIVALYHDQGLGPLKLWAFDQGVNITLGLPIIRTSPDHGTAFGIAGKALARPDSMIEALKAATKLSSQENPWKTSFPV